MEENIVESYEKVREAKYHIANANPYGKMSLKILYKRILFQLFNKYGEPPRQFDLE